MSQNEIAISVQELKKSYKNVTVLTDVDFEVKTGIHSKHTYVHTVFTSKGVTWIAKKVDKWLKEH